MTKPEPGSSSHVAPPTTTTTPSSAHLHQPQSTPHLPATRGRGSPTSIIASGSSGHSGHGGHAHFDIPEEVSTPAPVPGRKSTSPSTGSRGRASMPLLELPPAPKRRSRYSEIFAGPTNIKSLLIKRDFHLTWKVDNSYFTGKAGMLRLFALVLSVASFGCGLPGYSSTDRLLIGYGASFLIPLSMTLFSICIIINTVMVLLLLCFREVRCQSKWDDWNLKAFAVASAIATFAGIIQLGGVFHARRMNCHQDERIMCAWLYRERLHKPNKPELDMPYKNWHYVSICGKLVCAMCYSFCSRILLKNNDKIHSHLKIKHPRGR